jgi:general secretion pathway protein L
MATSDWLLLRLPANAGEVASWAVIDASGALRPLPDGDPAALAAGRQVALLAPSADVALFNALLPAGNEARLQQLAPFALEEQVSEDLDQLHFAVGSRDSGTGLVPVAVASRERMAQWMAQAASLSVTPRALYAESDLAPLLPGHVTMVIAADELVLRNDRARPVSFPVDDPELALTTLLGPEADLAAVNLAVYVSPDDWPRVQAAVEALRDRVASLKVQLFTSGLIGLYAQGISGSAPVNLLQGAFKVQPKGANAWLRWRAAAALLAGLLVLHAGGTLWELRKSSQQAAVLDEEIARVYGTIFPGQSPGPGLRRALEGRLKAAAGAGSPRGELTSLLAALAAAHQNVPVARLDSMSFKPGALQLKLSAPDAATLEQFSQALRAGGYGASVVSGGQTEGGFEGQIDMTAGT